MKVIVKDQNKDTETYAQMAEFLSKGGLVVSPSDSVYGLLVDATNQDAVQKLINFKQRHQGKPISVFVSDLKMLEEYGDIKTENQTRLLNKILPGPFTVVLDSKKKLDPLLESETGGIGLRFPDYKFITDFVKYYKKPVTATSANMAGRSPHYSVQSLLNSLSKSKQQMIDLIVDAGTLPRNKPSAVIDLTGDKLKTIREGDINVSAVNSFISDSAEQTFKLGKYIMQNIIKENKAIQGPIVIILKGDLGAGKTVFVKGVAEYLNIFDIVSPTYVIYYEYNIEQNNSFYNKLFHYDLYNIEDDKEFSYLGFQEALKSNNIICLEWGEKLGDNINLFKERGQLYILNIKHLSEEKRELVLEKVS